MDLFSLTLKTVAARGCLPPWANVCVAAPANQIGNILIVATTALVWTVTNSTLSWGECNYVTHIPAESVRQCKRQFARSGQISEFHIFVPRNAAPCTVPPGTHSTHVTAFRPISEPAHSWSYDNEI